MEFYDGTLAPLPPPSEEFRFANKCVLIYDAIIKANRPIQFPIGLAIDVGRLGLITVNLLHAVSNWIFWPRSVPHNHDQV